MILSQFDPKKIVCIDCETISWDDTRGALSPYHGDKLCGISLVQDGVGATYLPIRHRTDVEGCLPFEAVMGELRAFAKECVFVVNQNVKFDLHFMLQDDIVFSEECVFADTKTLARLVHNRLDEYSLDFLTKKYCKQYVKQGEPIKEWLAAHKTKDYGAVPIDMMRTYANFDTLSTLELYNTLMKLLPKESLRVWEEEKKFCRVLFDCERNGVLINPDFFQQVECLMLQKMVKAQEKITAMAGFELNPNSGQQINLFFQSQGIEPVAWNTDDDGNVTSPCWDGDALAQVMHPMANLLVTYKECNTALTTYCRGWVERMDANHVIHPQFHSSGTKTGRLSSSDPNMQNPPKWAMGGILIPDGEIGIKFDYSQIEYRIFAHFSKDEALLKLYREDPRIDFHQKLADRLGLLREVIKPINFGILYGMGVKKLKRNIAKLIWDLKPEEGDKKFDEKMERYTKLMEYLNYKYGGTLDEIAAKILEEYHQQVPAVKSLLDRVKNTIHARGNIRNFFYRYFQFTLDKAYVALNYLCQGTAADLFKNRVNAIFNDRRVRQAAPKMVTNIHDSVLSRLKSIMAAQVYWDAVQELSGVVPGLTVPILVDGEVAIGNWGNTMKIINNSIADTVAALKQRMQNAAVD